MNQKESYRRWECIRDTKESNSLHWIQETDSKIEHESPLRETRNIPVYYFPQRNLISRHENSMLLPFLQSLPTSVMWPQVNSYTGTLPDTILIQDSCQSLTKEHFCRYFPFSKFLSLLSLSFLFFIFSRQILVLLTHDSLMFLMTCVSCLLHPFTQLQTAIYCMMFPFVSLVGHFV